MKTILIWIFLFATLIGTITFLVMRKDAGEARGGNVSQVGTNVPVSFDQATVYQCPQGEIIAAALASGDTSVLELSLPNNAPIILAQVESASGAKYQTSEGLTFWEKEGSALVEKNGETLYRDCKVRIAGDPTIETEAPIETALSATKWVWRQSDYASSTVSPTKAGDFTLQFAAGSKFSANTDCNNIGGSYSADSGNTIAFSEIVSTLMACDGDIKEAKFTSMLTGAETYSLNVDGTELIIGFEDAAGAGSMQFTLE